MLISFAMLGFALAALSYLGLATLLLFRGASNATGRIFIAAIAAQTFWGASIALTMAGRPMPVAVIGAAEAARLFLWILLLVSLMRSAADSRRSDRNDALTRVARAGLVAAATVAAGTLATEILAFGEPPAFTVRVFGSVIALVCLEQVYRSSDAGGRWAIKFLAITILALFGFDLLMYSEALLFSRLNPALWTARGYANALLVPLLAVATARNQAWKLQISVSRDVVFHTTALTAAGLYLMLMAAAGYWVRDFGGEWGAAIQALILFVSAIAVLVLLMSGQVRAHVRVQLVKHFFRHRYDYRAEWQKLTQLLSEAPGQDGAEGEPLEVRALRGLGALVESNGGALWLSNDDRQYVCTARRTYTGSTPTIAEHDPLPVFLKARQWVISLPELRERPDLYDRLQLPTELTAHPENWLIVPLMLHDDLLGIVVLTRPSVVTEIDWEVRDALKAAARQVASYLGVRRAVESLVQARQFESFNRMSAFVVHDLKNLVAQLSLLLANAERHRDNPEFQQDMLDTIGNVQSRMQGLLLQLRAGTRPIEAPAPVPVIEVVNAAVRSKQVEAPAVRMELSAQLSGASVLGHRDRLERVIGHLIQNAAEASPRGAEVTVTAGLAQREVQIEVRDQGKGMSAQFIRERLFKPFQSTKNHGMGIGAFESREYVRELGGSLEVESRENEGSTFRIRLPLAVTEAAS